MLDYIFDIEKYLAHQIQACFFGGDIPVPFWENALATFVTSDKPRMLPNRAYFMLDFNDFIDYATSDLPGVLDFSGFSENQIYFYDALPGTYEEGIFESQFGEEFSIVGAAISRKRRHCNIFLQLRYLPMENFDVHEEVIHDKRSQNLFSSKHVFPYEFFYLSLTNETTTNNLAERLRCLLIPPIMIGDVEGYGFHFRNHDSSLAEFYEKKYKDSKLLEPETTEVFAGRIDECNNEFEMARHILHLPKYFEFMYDLVIDERKKAGRKIVSGKKHKGKKRHGKVIYRIVKSLHVSYSAEEETRKKIRTPKRTWTAPLYRFVVRGHWRILKHSWWKGHDSEKNQVLGRTWIREYEKGNSKTSEFGTEQKDPKVVVKLKQTLSYARDVITSHVAKESQEKAFVPLQIDKDVLSVSHSITKGDKPSDEWMYEERKKLTAGLRWLILKRDNFKCTGCGRGAEDRVKLEVDHIIPVSQWGKTEETNLRTLCRPCNQGKGDEL